MGTIVFNLHDPYPEGELNYVAGRGRTAVKLYARYVNLKPWP